MTARSTKRFHINLRTAGVIKLKSNRQQKILELIKEKIIITQEDLQNELEALGFKITQSTVSRDIKELRIVKGHDSAGNYRYISGDGGFEGNQTSLDHYRELFSKSAKSVNYALNNVVVKCYTGMASSACVALDNAFGDYMLGSLAGEDTIIVVTAGEELSKILTQELNKLL